MRIRVFGKIDPIEDMYYSTTLHLSDYRDIEIELDLSEIPNDNNWVVYYDEYIANILKLYNKIENHLDKKLPTKCRDKDRRLTSVVFTPALDEFAYWYFDYKYWFDEEHPMIVVTTNKKGRIIDLEY